MNFSILSGDGTDATNTAFGIIGSIVSIKNDIERLRQARRKAKTLIEQTRIDLDLANKEAELSLAELRKLQGTTNKSKKALTWLALGGAGIASLLAFTG